MAVVRRELQRSHLSLAQAAPNVQPRQAAPTRVLSVLSSLIVVGLALWLAYTLVADGLAWAQQKVDDVRYGYPRIYQTDGYLGYGETAGMPTHFIALNLHGQISMLVVNGSDPTKVRVLRGPSLLGDGQDQVAPTVRIDDVNHDGNNDLVLRVNDQDIVYLSNPARQTFTLYRPPTSTAGTSTPSAATHGS